jgi:hypothetical protein
VKARRSTCLLALVAVGVVGLGAGCSSSTPNAPEGFFPATYSEQSLPEGTQLVQASAVGASTKSFKFKANVSGDSGWTLVARCDRGTIQVDFGSSKAHGPCRGTQGVTSGCAGGLKRTLSVSVSEPQSQRWGLAIYRSSC